MIARLASNWKAHALTIVITIGLVVSLAVAHPFSRAGRSDAPQARGADARSVAAAAGPYHLVLSTPFGTFAFTQITDLTSQIQPNDFVNFDSKGTTIHTKQFGKTKPPSITLQRPFGAGQGAKTLFNWHENAVRGLPSARASMDLLLQNPAGTTVEDFRLQNAFCSKIQVGAVNPQTGLATMTVTIVADQITLLTN